MTLHVIEPERRTLHGHFSRDLAPVLSIGSGDTVRFRTLDAGWGLEPPSTAFATRRQFRPRDPTLDAGHALLGPIELQGAKPGMTLEVDIGAIVPGPWGWTRAGGWSSPLNERLDLAQGDQHLLVWTIDAKNATACDQNGRAVSIRPFMGIIGMPPDEPGIHPTWPPRACGGNIDCRELVSGSRLFLPIPVPGGLVSVGDGHAMQGDGEVSSTAIECPMELVELRFVLRDDLPISTPCAETPAGWITLGLHEDLNEAAAIALDAMLDLMTAHHHLDRKDALALASLAVDLRVTQIVNGTRGIHALLRREAIQGL
ncbi:MAG: acetamidase/formamidase family protein [Gemmatimonadales bacterium]